MGTCPRSSLHSITVKTLRVFVQILKLHTSALPMGHFKSIPARSPHVRRAVKLQTAIYFWVATRQMDNAKVPSKNHTKDSWVFEKR